MAISRRQSDCMVTTELPLVVLPILNGAATMFRRERYIAFASATVTTQPVETGEGRLFARAGAEVAGTSVKARAVGQYVGTFRFPNAEGWRVGMRFHDSSAKALELTPWMQEVRTSSPSEQSSRQRTCDVKSGPTSRCYQAH